MNKLVSVNKLSRALKSLWVKSKNLFATKSEVANGLSGKAEKTHVHDDRYYTENEADSKFLRCDMGIVTDFNKAVARGIYNVGSSDSIPNAPITGSLYGTLEVIHRSASIFIQRLTLSTGVEYIRYYSSTWTNWSVVYSSANKPTWNDVSGKPTSLPVEEHNHDSKYFRIDLPTITSGDFNNYYTDQGVHNVSSGTTIVNAPYTGGIYGLLTIAERSGGDIRQTFIDHNHKEFTRTRNGNTGAWSAWIKVFSSAQKPTWDDITGKPSSFPVAAHNHDTVYLKINNSDVTDFNLCKAVGPYSVRSNSSIPNAPFTGAIYGSLMVAIVSPNEVTQTFTSYNGRIYTRFLNDKNGGTWTAWSTIYTSANYGSIQAGVTITREGDRFYINY